MNFGEAVIRQLSIHKVGNKLSDATFILSRKPVEVADEMLLKLLSQYFFSSFKLEEYFHFFHENSLQYNEVYNYVKQTFEDRTSFHENTQHIARHLFEKSTHPRINSGELYVAYFDKVLLDGEETDAVGIFKSETKESFLKIVPSGDQYDLGYEEGININKLDKGCIIFNSDKEDGFQVCVVDNINKSLEAQYWRDDFLKIKQREDKYFQTEQFLKMTKQFITKELPDQYEVSRADQADLLNKSIRYFKEQEGFDLDDFTEQVIIQDDMAASFRDYKTSFEADTDTRLPGEFEISSQAVKRQARIYKSVLKLDRNFHIYIHGDKDRIERGYDEAAGLHYYKVYFEEEN